MVVIHDQDHPIPGRYAAAIAVMSEMHWSWHELISAPADLVDEIVHRMEAKHTAQRQREKLDAAKRSASSSKTSRVRRR